MADDPHNTSDVSEPVEAPGAKEDAETTAARRELKQTSISEKIAGEQGTKTSTQDDQSGSDDDAARGTKAVAGRITPDTDLGDSKGDLRERVASPKKKRAHAELIADGSNTTSGEGSSKPTVTAVTQTRTEASEPEKKRHRDAESTRRRSQDGEVSCAPIYSHILLHTCMQGAADRWAHTLHRTRVTRHDPAKTRLQGRKRLPRQPAQTSRPSHHHRRSPAPASPNSPRHRQASPWPARSRACSAGARPRRDPSAALEGTRPPRRPPP